jgi:DNA (cytosine-5)-methyltransferase 1
MAPQHRKHDYPTAKMGRPATADQFIHVVGNFSGVAHARAAMGVPWMTRDELREAVPPAYTEFVGRQIIAAIEQEAA